MDDACGVGTGGLALEAFDPAPVAIALTSGPRHHLMYVNAAYRAYFGDRPLGVPIQEAFAGLGRLDCPDLFDRVLARVTGTGPGDRRIHYAAAGHPPPLLVTAEGDARLLEDAANPLLGFLFDGPYDSATEPLPPGATLLLYTDGLVERPGEHLDTGLNRLRERARALSRRPLHRFCDALLDGLPTSGTDDIAVIALRVPG